MTKRKSRKGKHDLFDELIEGVNKNLKRTALTQGTTFAEIRGFIPTGCTLLDLLFKGGIPMGRITEIYGKESIGKSTLGSHLIAETQKIGGLVTVLDSEAGMDRQSVERIGADFDRIMWHDSAWIEDGFETISALIRQLKEYDDPPPLLILWDTIAASPTQKEYEEGHDTLAAKARAMSLELRRVTADIAEQGIALVFLNQVRDRIGVQFGEKEITPGGRAVKFHSSLRVRVSAGRPGIIKKSGKEIGQNVRFFVKKMKYGTPRRQVDVPLLFDTGLDEYRSLLYWLQGEGRTGPLDKDKSGVYSSGSRVKVDLPSGTKSFFDSKFEDNLDDEMKEFLNEQVVLFWERQE